MILIFEKRRGVRCRIRPRHRFYSCVRGFCVLPGRFCGQNLYGDLYQTASRHQNRNDDSAACHLLIVIRLYPVFLPCPLLCPRCFFLLFKWPTLKLGSIRDLRQFISAGWSNAATQSNKMPETVSELLKMPSTRLYNAISKLYANKCATEKPAVMGT